MEQIVINCNDASWWDSMTPEEFQYTFRLSKESVRCLQSELNNDIDKVDCTNNFDKSLLAFLWVLGTESNLNEVTHLFEVADIKSCLRKYASKLLALGKDYIMWPTEDESKRIETLFASQYGFAGVIGVVGTLYVEVKSDLKIFLNRKVKKSMIALQVVCDGNHLIRDLALGFPGRKTVDEILWNSPLYSKLVDPNGFLIKNQKHLLGGSQHPELKTLLTPYNLTRDGIDKKKLQYNSLHESVMKTVEDTFKQIESRFPRMTSLENYQPAFASHLMGAICVLHNFCLVKNDLLK